MIDCSILQDHKKIAFSFSGGKDSLAVLYLLQDHLEKITVYYVDTGDAMPETLEVIAEVKQWIPHFVHIQTDVHTWTQRNGIPSDIVPTTCTPIGLVSEMSQNKIVDRFQCCWENIMKPLWTQIVADGNTLLIRGTKLCDVPRSPTKSGDREGDITLWYPIEDWSDDDVFEYLVKHDAPISRVYIEDAKCSDCLTCSAWWSDKRAGYLREHHPVAYQKWHRRTNIIASELNPLIFQMNSELKA